MNKRRMSLLASLLVLLTACSAPAGPEQGTEGVLVYYLLPEEEARGADRIGARWESLALPEGADDLAEAQAVVERLMAGPGDESMYSPLPEGVELLGLELRDRTAYVDFSGEIRDLSGVELALADYCLTLSLTALDSVRAVTVTAQGRPLGQQPKQVFYERDVLLSDMGDVLQTVEVSLYFLNADGALAAEKRMLSLYEGQTLAEALVAALLEGPESRELLRAVPEGFAINYVRVDSGVCYLSLPASSLALLPQDGQTQQMILWSLADSLYSIDSVEEIRLLADGEELKLFGSVPVESIAVRPQG
ncbi:MAG: GerMN domain-containing protein [Oscillospiraceae bacterium]|nr:GerMN domain-containing protein [Oscillospiraceae bacterium]